MRLRALHFGLIAILLAGCGARSNLPSAQKPSFDCVNAKTSVEKTICSSSTLSAADAKLATTYKSVLDRLPNAMRAGLRVSQRAWIKSSQSTCAQETTSNATLSCLDQNYKDRQRWLELAVVDAAGMRIFRIDRSDTHKSKSEDEPGKVTIFDVTNHIAYPRIENAITPGQKGFNAQIRHMTAEFANDKDKDTDYDFDYSSIDVSGRLISVDINQSFYPHGAAHPLSASLTFHWLLRENRKLRADDVFNQKTKWTDFLSRYCFEDLSKKQKIELVSIDAVGDLPTQPWRWQFSGEGLVIHFNPYEVASYAEGMPEVLIPWRDLKPYLLPDPAIR